MEKMKQAAFLLLMAVMNATGVWMLLLRLLQFTRNVRQRFVISKFRLFFFRKIKKARL